MSKGYTLGRAFEYACLTQLEKYLRQSFPDSGVVLDQAASYYLVVKSDYESCSEAEREKLTKGAEAFLPTLSLLEPMLKYPDGALLLSLQTDNQGTKGDVRDVLISRNDGKWEIGLSLKHNHTALKHSRLSKDIDFADSWVGSPCSDRYWEDIKPVFDALEEKKGVKWSELESKEELVYVPILQAFTRELLRQSEKSKEFPKRLVDYLVGRYDFYKIISADSKKVTYIEPFNLNGALNQSSPDQAPAFPLQKISTPTRVVTMVPKQNSKTTVELYMDNGWQFNFRIHSASTYVETSLKLDVQLAGCPVGVIMMLCPWK